MFSKTLLLTLLIAHPAFIIAAPQPATNGNTQQSSGGGDAQVQSGSSPMTAAKLPYTITSAYIHQYDGQPAVKAKIKARQQQAVAQPAANLTAVNSTDLPLGMDPSGGSQGPAAAPRPSTMENFNLTVVSGAGNGSNVFCNLTWDAGTANSGTRDHIANETFSCDDSQTHVRMERRNVTPLYGFYIFVQMPGAPVAAWMVKDLNSDASKRAGWIVDDSDDVFKGTAYLTQDAHQTLADFLEVPV